MKKKKKKKVSLVSQLVSQFYLNFVISQLVSCGIMDLYKLITQLVSCGIMDLYKFIILFPLLTTRHVGKVW